MEAKITEIAPDIFRICSYQPAIDLGFNQFLIRDDDPLLFHTGMRAMFPVVREALATLIDPARLRWISFSHFEADECGSLNEFLAIAPRAQALCSFIGAMVSVNDFGTRPARGLQDGETVALGKRRVRLIATPQVPHGWDAAALLEETTRTLFCSDLFHQDGDLEPMIESEGELLRRARETMVRYQSGPMANYLAYGVNTPKLLAKLAESKPAVLAAMHGSAFRGDGAHALGELAGVMREVLGG